MASDTPTIRRFLADTHPFDLLSERALTQAATAAEPVAAVLGQTFWRSGESVPGLMAIEHGAVEILSPEGTRLSRLGSGDVFGERGLMRDGLAPNTAVATEPAALYCLPPKTFHALLESEPGFARFFGRTPAPDAVPAHQGDLSMLGIEALMSAGPVTAAPDLSVAETAQLMSARAISCVLIVDEGRLAGLVTASDLCARVLAEGRAPETPIAAVMTPMPLALEAGSLGLDALRTMVERRIGHLPVVEQGRPVGIVTRTDLIGHQALSAPALHTDI
ncbi:MAG: CBS domain-containing protein, partial [Pseudomonadota bacterium]